MPLLTPIIVLPEGAAATIGANASQVLADLSPIWLLVGGILLGVAVVGIVIGMLHKK